MFTKAPRISALRHASAQAADTVADVHRRRRHDWHDRLDAVAHIVGFEELASDATDTAP